MCNFRLIIILIVFFLHGCTTATTKPSPEIINDNTYYGKRPLFAQLVSIKGKYIFQNLTSKYKSKNEPWVRLNDLKPMFTTQPEVECYLGIGIATLGAKKDGEICTTNSHSLFRVERASSPQKIANGIMLAVTLGLTGTGRATNIIFDRYQYERAIAAALVNAKLSRKELLRLHDDLWAEWESEKKSYIAYKNNNINPRIKVIDKSGLYKNNNVGFSKIVTVQEHTLTSPDHKFLLDNVTSDTPDTVMNIKEKLKTTWKNEKESYLVTCTSGEKNGFNYLINCPKKINKNNTAFPVNVTVLSKNIKRLIPHDFVGRDKILEVKILNGEIIARNLTNTYISLNSFSIYYIDKISTKTFLNLELPPYSEKNISLNNFTYKLPSMSRTKYTSNKARKEIIKYGFAAKYTSSDKNIENTLHKTKEYTGIQVYSLLHLYTSRSATNK